MKDDQTSEHDDTSDETSESVSEAASPIDASREELIRRAAHRRYEARGGADGDEVQDWLEAEAEVDGLEDEPPATTAP